MRCILPPAKDDRTHYEDQYQQPGNQFNMLLHQSVKIDSIATKPLVLYILWAQIQMINTLSNDCDSST